MSIERPTTAGTQDTQTKYSVSQRERWGLAADVPITDHALERYKERTPEDCDVRPATAWQRGEDMKHPGVLELDSGRTPPVRARVYHHDQEWLVVFVVVEREPEGDRIVATVYGGHTHEHGPTQAYIHSHGPHYVSDSTHAEAGETGHDDS